MWISRPRNLQNDPDHDISKVHGDEPADLHTLTMPDFTLQMTVREMIDVIAFLESRYRLLAPGYEG